MRYIEELVEVSAAAGGASSGHGASFLFFFDRIFDRYSVFGNSCKKIECWRGVCQMQEKETARSVAVLVELFNCADGDAVVILCTTGLLPPFPLYLLLQEPKEFVTHSKPSC